MQFLQKRDYRYMEKSKLIQLLKSLSKKEFGELEHFVKSPIHNKDKDAVKLYQYLKKCFPDFPTYKIKKEQVTAAVYGTKNDKNLKKLKYPASAMTKCVEDYILWKGLQKEQRDADILSLKVYQKRGLDKFFLKKVEDIKRALESNPEIGHDYYLFKHIMYELVYDNTSTSRVGDKFEEVLQQKKENLELFYTSTRLYHYLQDLNRTELLFSANKPAPFNMIIKEIEGKALYDKHPIFEIYVFLAKNIPTVDSFDAEETKRVLLLFYENARIFSYYINNTIALLFIQFLTKVYNHGNVDLISAIFSIIKFGIEKKILHLENGNIMPIIFYNAIIFACENGAFDWSNFLLEKEAINLPNTHRDSIISLSNAYINTSQGNHDACLTILSRVNYKKHYYFYDIMVKTLVIRCYFEQKESNLLYNYLETFYAFVRRHNLISVGQKERFNRYGRFVLILDNNRYSRKYTKKELYNKLSQEKNIYFRSWLNRMITKQ